MSSSRSDAACALLKCDVQGRTGDTLDVDDEGGDISKGDSMKDGLRVGNTSSYLSPPSLPMLGCSEPLGLSSLTSSHILP
ncbi:hypothetical protein X798_04073 [Onchocerca flexuosa]|uniref:Uncharacterized protein n=1 Tax=Onchocerca flexuosa TaxID=387005 RepID=A0A238BJR4_9BILA|nr:hypothetical protein X798_07595 [Onchocerca flexuosa]OZC08841.1 hypothetical protein X798_04073 [Onchocerca flexuosa]